MNNFLTSYQFLNNPKKGINFYKRYGYLIVKNVLKKSDYKFLLETIFSFSVNSLFRSLNKRR